MIQKPESGTPSHHAARSSASAVLKVNVIRPPAAFAVLGGNAALLRQGPIYEGEPVLGFQVYAAAKSEVFYPMGLKQRDVTGRRCQSILCSQFVETGITKIRNVKLAGIRFRNLAAPA